MQKKLKNLINKVIFFVFLIIIAFTLDNGYIRYGVLGLLGVSTLIVAFRIYQNWDYYKFTVNNLVSMIDLLKAPKKNKHMNIFEKKK